jgi:hypothetical protein
VELKIESPLNFSILLAMLKSIRSGLEEQELFVRLANAQ